MKGSNEILQAVSPSASMKDEKQSVSDALAQSDENLRLREDSGDYPAPFTRWAIVIALLLGEFLVSSRSPQDIIEYVCG